MSVVRARILIAVIVAAVLWGLWILADGTRPYLHSTDPVWLEIPKGSSVSRIARQLEAAGVIRSRVTFLWLHYLRPVETLKAGEYAFEQPASALEVLDRLIRGDVRYELVRIPEGYNRFEIAALVAERGLSTQPEFVEATANAALVADLDPQAEDLEGYLFPDSYRFSPRATPEQMVRAMVERSRQVYADLASPPNAPPVRELVIMASLIEKETGVPEERPLVAAVFYNRLRRGIALQCDPTVIYAALLENRYDGKIRQSHLNSPSPYNTYVHRGLPPGPIANPGEASLRAALRPADEDYLYFVANQDGGHTFSRTLAEHNLAVRLYRKSVSNQ